MTLPLSHPAELMRLIVSQLAAQRGKRVFTEAELERGRTVPALKSGAAS